MSTLTRGEYTKYQIISVTVISRPARITFSARESVAELNTHSLSSSKDRDIKGLGEFTDPTARGSDSANVRPRWVCGVTGKEKVCGRN